MEVVFKPTQADVEEIKAILGIDISDSSKNAYIETMLPLLLESVMAHTNNNFNIAADGTLRIPGGVKIYLAKAIERNTMKSGLKSRSMGSVSYSYDTQIPDELRNMLKPYKKVRFHGAR